mmetsp:Transcript_57579/g.160353  ORF Transcript_57579/g.160353 Transcript_57579/m.160353 type:complete len:305 (+) Transcript_57579:81-995(+)
MCTAFFRNAPATLTASVRTHHVSRRATHLWERDAALDCSAPRSRHFFGAWTSFFQGSRAEDSKAAVVDIRNCGADLGVPLPRSDLVLRPGMKRGAKDWEMQLYGAAVYWRVATVSGAAGPNPDLLRDRDVLEVGCMLGGGARYLAEVIGTRSYVAIDNNERYVSACQQLHSPWPGLRYELADARALDQSFAPESFDAVLGVQLGGQNAHEFVVEDMQQFIREAERVLRPGGFLSLCEHLGQKHLEAVVETIRTLGLSLEVLEKFPDKVSCLGICLVAKGSRDTYAHIVARKQRVPGESTEGPAR